MEYKLLEISADNIDEYGIYCLKNKKLPGYSKKIDWFKENINNGLKIIIAIDKEENQIGYIEYMPSEIAYRPLKAKNFYFIQCMVIFKKINTNQGLGSALIKACEEDAIRNNKYGVCTFSSDGSWMANKHIFIKNNYSIIDKKGRFELLGKYFNSNTTEVPTFIDWERNLTKYKGWNLVYSNQCPMHHKSVTDLELTAEKEGINLNIIILNSPNEVQNSPSGFGTFGLIKDGVLLADHYISKTRFENIIKKVLLK